MPPAMHDTADTRAARLDLAAIQALAAADMQALDRLIRQRLASDVVLINQVAEYIIGAGGKRLRPMLLLLAAGALGESTGKPIGADAHQLAAVVEFIHTSTLLHDDVVDESDLRRGRQTANAVWGNAASVLVGDFLYSRSFQLMVEVESMQVQRILADTTNTIAEGEVLQLLHVRNPDTDEAAYLRVIERKTAILFAAATLGKNLGDDLAEGKMTLPLIHAMAQADAGTCQRLRRIVEQGDMDALPEVMAAIAEHDSLAYCRARAQAYARDAEAALLDLPDNAYVAALRGLAHYAVSRDH